MNEEHATEQAEECKVRVNEDVVVLVGDQHKPADIKRTAIEQGVEIKQDFVLSIIEDGQKKTRIVVEDEVIVVKADTCFAAVAHDDNS